MWTRIDLWTWRYLPWLAWNVNRRVRSDALWRALVWRLPRPLVYWAFIRVAAHGTTGRYGSTEPDRLSVIEAMKRWETARG